MLHCFEVIHILDGYYMTNPSNLVTLPVFFIILIPILITIIVIIVLIIIFAILLFVFRSNSMQYHSLSPIIQYELANKYYI